MRRGKRWLEERIPERRTVVWEAGKAVPSRRKTQGQQGGDMHCCRF
jgi:hypothetical protein